MDAMSIEDFLGGERARRAPPAMAADLLGEYLCRYQEFLIACPFKQGDLVTPLASSNTVGPGEPCVVLELRSGGPIFYGDRGTPEFGARCDMRIARFMEGDNIVRFWVESVDFEPYKPAL